MTRLDESCARENIEVTCKSGTALPEINFVIKKKTLLKKVEKSSEKFARNAFGIPVITFEILQ